jgi:hypothetical protein
MFEVILWQGHTVLVNFETHLNKIQNSVGKEKAGERIYLSHSLCPLL